jgi:transposase
MSTPATPPSCFIGCDVGKACIVVCDSRTERTTTIANRPQDLAAFAAALPDGCLVICEATGGHEIALLDALEAAGHAAHRADARKVKAFIRSFGTLGKSDTIDARALRSYGEERHARLDRWQTPQAHRQQLQALVLARRDFVAQRLACANRLGAPTAGAAKPYLEALLACLDQQIEAIEGAIQTLIASHPPLHRAAQALRRVPGVGPAVAAGLMGLMPELGRVGRHRAAALAGLAPHPQQSGASDGYRAVRGGRPEVRRIVFMAALSAARHHPALKLFYEKLRRGGKKPLVALTAVMRKLVVICNAVVRDANAIAATSGP